MNAISSRTPRAHHDLMIFLLAFALVLTPIVQNMPQVTAPAWRLQDTPPVTAPAAQQDAPPASLSEGEWQSVQSQMRAAEYNYTWHAPSAGYRAPNRYHGWQTTFTSQGAVGETLHRGSR